MERYSVGASEPANVPAKIRVFPSLSAIFRTKSNLPNLKFFFGAYLCLRDPDQTGPKTCRIRLVLIPLREVLCIF